MTCRLRRRCTTRDRRHIIVTKRASLSAIPVLLTLSPLVLQCLSLSSSPLVVPHGSGDGGGHVFVRSYFATCIPGLENALASELTNLGADNVRPGRSGVAFTEPPESSATNEDGDRVCSMEIGMRAILWLRTAHRVMELISTTDEWGGEGHADRGRRRSAGIISDRDDLYDFVRDTVDVRDLLGDGRGGMLSLAVKATSGGRLPKELCHSHYSALTVKNALVDACRELRDDGRRPDVDTDDPSVPLVLALRGVDGRGRGRGASASLYRCLSGHASLHRRGYRYDDAIHRAAMKESMASGLLLESGWNLLVDAAKRDGHPAILVDPMAGSGTFCIEAALMAADVAPGLIRQRLSHHGGGSDRPYVPPAIRWKRSDPRRWVELLREAAEREKIGMRWLHGENVESGRPNCVIVGNDVNANSIGLARRCAQRARVDGVVRFHEGSCRDWRLREGDDDVVVEGRTIVVVNPPWGVRLTDDIGKSWDDLKEFFRRECGGTEAWVLSGNRDLTRLLRMKRSRSVALNTSDEKLRWLQYHIFKSEQGEESNNPDEGRIKEESIR